MVKEKWKKAREALAPLGCLQLPTDDEDDDYEYDEDDFASSFASGETAVPRRHSDTPGFASSSSTQQPEAFPTAFGFPRSPSTPQPSSKGLMRFFKKKPSAQKKIGTCAICRNTVIQGQGHAIFIAECSHPFHHNCITSNLKHGNRVCPVCMAKWKEIPFQIQTPAPRENLRGAFIPLNRNYPLATAQPGLFDDDELIVQQISSNFISGQGIEIRAVPEVSAIPKSNTFEEFTVLLHLKAPNAGSQNSRAPVDLVTVLDISGSMGGTKLALLKKAMGLVIQHLGPHDRLSVIAFSAVARRLFPLRLMTDIGKHLALQAVNSLSSNSGTDVADGLSKGMKVILDRKSKNPVSSIILLSDGNDTFTDNTLLLPVSVQQIPVHTFGFGPDHNAAILHSISENSGGTFSFIEDDSVIEEAFGHCMGGLLSVIAQEVAVFLERLCASVELQSIKAGSYQTELTNNSRKGLINVGDLYAEEERDFLVTMNIPISSDDETLLLKLNCTYRDPLTYDMRNIHEVVVKIDRTETTEILVGSIEVDRQRNRLRAADAMSEARSAAEHGDFDGAVLILERCREIITVSTSSQADDAFSVGLCKELSVMQESMANLQVYEASGRGYVLSGLGSFSRQRDWMGPELRR